MPDDLDLGPDWDMQEEALAIIKRRRPDLKGKSLVEVQAILRAEHPKTDRRCGPKGSQ